jgi:WD40 repeat protein
MSTQQVLLIFNALQKNDKYLHLVFGYRSRELILQLECQNFSNLSQHVSIEIKEGEEKQPKCFWEVQPDIVELHPGEIQNLQLLISKRRRWFGITQKLTFKVKAIVSDRRINVNNENQFLQVIIHPILHLWLQIGLGILLLYLLWFLSWLNPNNPFFGHRDSVTSVQFNGVGDRAVSGSQDQSIIRWNLAGFTNPLINQDDGRMAKKIGKSVRIVRYKPVDNDIVAAGLENGEIFLRDVLKGSSNQVVFSFDQADRVLGLEFSQDSHFLFSGHGSGLVLQWDINSALLGDGTTFKKPINIKNMNFAVSALSLAGHDKQNLVIAGRYNKLFVWNFSQNKLWNISYNPLGSQNDYIVSADVAEYKPILLATADNMGQITLWNMQQCLNENTSNCQILEKWSDGHGGKAVRSVALSRSGCYLVSGGDDNRVVLWPLTQEGKRAFSNGTEIRKEKKKFNSVDIKVVKNQILIISGNDDHKVRVDMRDIDKNASCKE